MVTLLAVWRFVLWQKSNNNNNKSEMSPRWLPPWFPPLVFGQGFLLCPLEILKMKGYDENENMSMRTWEDLNSFLEQRDEEEKTVCARWVGIVVSIGLFLLISGGLSCLGPDSITLHTLTAHYTLHTAHSNCTLHTTHCKLHNLTANYKIHTTHTAVHFRYCYCTPHTACLTLNTTQ